jgi:hypothetical protein
MARRRHWRCRPQRALPRTPPPAVDDGDCGSGEGGFRAVASVSRRAPVPAPPRRSPSQGGRPARRSEDAGGAGALAMGCGCPVRLPPCWLLARWFRAPCSVRSLQPRPSAARAAPCDDDAANCAAAACAVALRLLRPSQPGAHQPRSARRRVRPRRPAPLRVADPNSSRPDAADGDGAAGDDGDAVCRPPPRGHQPARAPKRPPRMSAPCSRTRGRRPRTGPADRSMDALRWWRRTLRHSRSGAAPVAYGRRLPPLSSGQRANSSARYKSREAAARNTAINWPSAAPGAVEQSPPTEAAPVDCRRHPGRVARSTTAAAPRRTATT